ncbi:MAG: 50S ribosomal protein L4 [Anaerolineae bacterium]|nr:50S ribosomal protein L4 [Anaerolineae bacterium]
MKVDVVDLNGKKVKEIELAASIFEAPVNVDLMHQAYVRQMANAHLGTHDTKVRGEVSGGGRKPWRQKGTGRARQGSTHAAQWVGGGRIHTPHPRSYDLKMPLKMRRAAVRSALSARASESAIVVVENLAINEPKTSLLSKAVKNIVGNQTALLVIPEKDSRMDVLLSADNLSDVKVLMAKYLNIRDLLNYDRIIMEESSIDVLESFLSVKERAK